MPGAVAIAADVAGAVAIASVDGAANASLEAERGDDVCPDTGASITGKTSGAAALWAAAALGAPGSQPVGLPLLGSDPSECTLSGCAAHVRAAMRPAPEGGERNGATGSTYRGKQLDKVLELTACDMRLLAAAADAGCTSMSASAEDHMRSLACSSHVCCCCLRLIASTSAARASASAFASIVQKHTGPASRVALAGALVLASDQIR